ncbi:MAG: hypothetical protein ACFE0I_09690 [Elainellaceae cyanobacterium]
MNRLEPLQDWWLSIQNRKSKIENWYDAFKQRDIDVQQVLSTQ